ncbi:MAG: 4Fe-4S dicluster domain-containing protein [Bacteriovoracia bacterium]
MEKNKDFTPPRYWQSMQELDASYWEDAQAMEKREQEFLHKPIETIGMIDRLDKAGLARRDFMTIMGASMAMATMACARRPVHKIIPYVVKPEEIVPGVANHYASTCQECSTGCGTLVKTREGRPIKLEGNPDHPLNRGGLCSKGQASVLGLYDPDRLRHPMAGGNKATWDQLDGEIMKKLRANGKGVRILSDEVIGPSTTALIGEFLRGLGGSSAQHIEFEPHGLEEMWDAHEIAFGSRVQPHFHFQHAEEVVSVGADFLGEWINPLEHTNDWTKRRVLDKQDPKKAEMSKLTIFESVMSLTGANADERVIIPVGAELKIVGALTHEVMRLGGKTAGNSALGGYTPEAVAGELGGQVTVAKIKEVASGLHHNRGKSIVVGGGLTSRDANALGLQIALIALNVELGNYGRTIDVAGQAVDKRASFAGVKKLIAEMNAGQVSALIIHRLNPVYNLPASLGFEAALKKVGMVVAVADRVDETAKHAHFVAAENHGLESWGDASARRGVYSLQQPTIAPMYDTRSFQDCLLAWSGKKLGEGSDWHAYLKNQWKQTMHGRFGAGRGFDEFWDASLQKGVVLAAVPSASGGSFRAASLSRVPAYAKSGGEGLRLALYEKGTIGDGRFANNAWLQELPDPISTATWDNYINIGPATAKQLGVTDDDVVRVTPKGGQADDSVILPVVVQPGMHPNAVSVALGYGRTAAGLVGNGAGKDMTHFVTEKNGQLIFSGAEVSVTKTGTRYSVARAQWSNTINVMGNDRPIYNEMTLATYRKNPGYTMHTDPHLKHDTFTRTLWSEHKYKGHKWGMSIDLNACTGCGACTVACQAENNIPVVGRDRVRVSRQMHWIRMDRYYSGPADAPSVVFQPMLCQHCDNAPCETVCPVLATVHSDEGLNEMTYNRCVGTRYCQNNCPYKVRRFNFFDHWKDYQEPMHNAWNPDVTVRGRGVMEKCTFCVQRIQEGKSKAKDLGIKLKDGMIKPACQQTCSTNAIVFGDLNDPESAVAKLAKDQRAMRVLEVLNTKPAITYLSKVRNRAEAAGDHHGSH